MTEKELGAQRVPGYLAHWQTELDKTLQKIWLAKQCTYPETGLCHCSFPEQYSLVAASSLDTEQSKFSSVCIEEMDVKRIRMLGISSKSELLF